MQGRYGAAEQVYREDLIKLHNNGWSLYGLYQALEAQGRDAEAVAVKKEFDFVWRFTDIAIARSVF